MKIHLMPNDLKLFAAAISWTLWSPLYRSSPPMFRTSTKKRLQEMFDVICQELHSSDPVWSATLDEDALVIRGQVVATGSSEIQALRVCLEACNTEIGHSPTEVLAVTGLPVELLRSLLDRTSHLAHCAS
jgi:hypothetical protein